MTVPNKLELRGFDTLNAGFRALPSDLKRESDPILGGRARRAQAALQAAYPEITGGLRAGVRVVERAARGVASLFTLVSGAPYAHIYEFGSYRQPPRATFLPISETERRESVVDVSAMVESHGLTVRGDRD